MSRIEPSADRTHLRSFLALLIFVWTNSTSEAHSLAVDRGLVEVLPDRTIVHLEIPITDLVGHRTGRDVQRRFEAFELHDSARVHETDLLRRMAIRETSGERLEGSVETAVLGLPDGKSFAIDELHERFATYRLVYPTANPPHHLSFQQSHAHPTHGVLRPIRLSVSSKALDGPRTVRLTRGGNVETLTFSWDDGGRTDGGTLASDGACADHRADDDRFRSIKVVVRIDDRGVFLETIVPLPIMETWLPIPRVDRHFVEVGEQIEATGDLQAFFELDDVVRIDGHRVTPVIETPRFLGPEDCQSAGGRPSRRIGAWTGRVAVVRRYLTDSRPLDVSIEWRKFNATVLTADALVEVDGQCSEHRLSTYTPHLGWPFKTKRR